MYHSSYDEIGPGSRCREFIFTPKEYNSFGRVIIRNPPLICTSFQELADASWYLSVYVRYIPTYGHTKLKYHFSDPDRNGNPFLVFKLWAKGNLLQPARTTPAILIRELVERDLTPNFSRPPSFSLVPKGVIEVKEIIKETAPTLESEYDWLVALNAQRKEYLKGLKVGNNETPSSDGTALSLSA